MSQELVRAFAAERAGQLADAARTYTSLLRAQESVAEAAQGLSRIALAAESPEAGLELLAWVRPESQQTPSLLTARGQLLERLNRFDDALSCYEQALAIDPADTVASLGRDICRGRFGVAGGRGQAIRTNESDGGRSEDYLGVAIADGSRRFDESERQVIRQTLPLLPRAMLERIRTIRAEKSSGAWLGRYSGEGLIELNEGWDRGTLLHELGHALYEGLSPELQEEWETLFHRTIKEDG